TVRVNTATAIRPTTIFCIERRAMLRALHAQAELSEKFTASLLARNVDLEEGLCDQLFNHSEKRLAPYPAETCAFRPKRCHARCQNAANESLDSGRNGGQDAHFMNKFSRLLGYGVSL